MGDPRRLRQKYTTPLHPWKKETIEIEKALQKEYALKNKQEIWRMDSTLRNFKIQTKKLIAQRSLQSDRERTQLLNRVQSIGLLPAGAKIGEVLSLSTKNILERRLQSFVFRRGLARSMKQARQLITHKHFRVSGKIITSPSHLVTKSEEDLIEFSAGSPFHDPDHPERAIQEKTPVADKKKSKADKKEEIRLEPAAKTESKKETKQDQVESKVP